MSTSEEIGKAEIRKAGIGLTAHAHKVYRRHRHRGLVAGTAAIVGVAATILTPYASISLAAGAAAFLLCARKNIDELFGPGLIVGFGVGGVVAMSLVGIKNGIDPYYIPDSVQQKIEHVCPRPGLAFDVKSSSGRDYAARMVFRDTRVAIADAQGKTTVTDDYTGSIKVTYSYKSFVLGRVRTKTETLQTPDYAGPYKPGAKPANCWDVYKLASQ